MSRFRAVVLVLAAACDRGGRDTSAPPPLPVAPTLPVAGACTLAPIPAKLALTPKRLVAVGDLHGDLSGTRAALRAAGAIDDKDAWIGGDLVIVQTGDVLDRGDDEPDIYALLERLAGEAQRAGGALVLLNGNHELMNTALDFRYVTPEGMTDFGNRERAFAPGGAWAKRIAKYNAIAIVGDTVFSHAGVLPDWITQIDAANLESRCWLDGQTPELPALLTGEESPVWTRAYGMPEVDCTVAATVLGKLGVKRMVVGHTVQPSGITSACNDTVWRIDVGLSKLYGGPIQVLEVVPAVKVLAGTR